MRISIWRGEKDLKMAKKQNSDIYIKNISILYAKDPKKQSKMESHENTRKLLSFWRDCRQIQREFCYFIIQRIYLTSVRELNSFLTNKVREVRQIRWIVNFHTRYTRLTKISPLRKRVNRIHVPFLHWNPHSIVVGQHT